MTGLRRALAALGALAFALGIGALLLVLGSDHQSQRGLAAALILGAAWSFVGTGLYAWYRRPANRIGPLMTAVGFAWFLEALTFSGSAAVFSLGMVATALPFAILIHLLVTFPSGRLETRLQKALVGLVYLDTTLLQLAWFVLYEPAAEGCDGCPANPILIEGQTTLHDAVNAGQLLIAIAAIAAVTVLVFRRWRRSSAERRRALTPVLATAELAFGFLVVQLVASGIGVSQEVESGAFIASIAVFACLPFAFLAGLLRSRIGRDEEARLALSAENEQLTAELRAKVEELRASRARIVAAGHRERRRVERDLHDGAQQRLVALTMNLRLAREKLDSEPEAVAELLEEALSEVGAATVELRELARGIHPAILSDRGLDAALGGLAERSPVPVAILETPSERLPEAVELASYFVIAEALTNVARYAEAEEATVRVTRREGLVEVEVRDDGIGGADPSAGSGLRGLADRVATLEGGFEVIDRGAGEGTIVRASIPCA